MSVHCVSETNMHLILWYYQTISAGRHIKSDRCIHLLSAVQMPPDLARSRTVFHQLCFKHHVGCSFEFSLSLKAPRFTFTKFIVQWAGNISKLLQKSAEDVLHIDKDRNFDMVLECWSPPIDSIVFVNTLTGAIQVTRPRYAMQLEKIRISSHSMSPKPPVVVS